MFSIVWRNTLKATKFKIIERLSYWVFIFGLQAQKEAAEAEEMARELGLNTSCSEDNLKQLIMKRDRKGEMDGIIAGLEAKYCKPKKQKTSKGKKK